MFVEIVPITKRARERVKQHGKIMLLVRIDTFDGEPAILCESLKQTAAGKKKWGGWFTAREANYYERQDHV